MGLHHLSQVFLYTDGELLLTDESVKSVYYPWIYRPRSVDLELHPYIISNCWCPQSPTACELTYHRNQARLTTEFNGFRAGLALFYIHIVHVNHTYDWNEYKIQRACDSSLNFSYKFNVQRRQEVMFRVALWQWWCALSLT